MILKIIALVALLDYCNTSGLPVRMECEIVLLQDSEIESQTWYLR